MFEHHEGEVHASETLCQPHYPLSNLIAIILWSLSVVLHIFTTLHEILKLCKSEQTVAHIE